MLRVNNLKLEINRDESLLKHKIIKELRLKEDTKFSYTIAKKAIDSRKKPNIFYVYSVDVKIINEAKYLINRNTTLIEEKEYTVAKKEAKVRPVIIGAGPAGLMNALVLAEAGLKPIIIEQGKEVNERKRNIDTFWANRKLDTNSNMQFGAGGAGTFSDGKLQTGVKDPRSKKLMTELVNCGAPEEILYTAKAHVGTDILINVVDKLCKKIISLGGEIRYNTKFVRFEEVNGKVRSVTVVKDFEEETIPCENLVVAIGHSSRDTVYNLYNQKLNMAAKNFSVGVRIEHKQTQIDTCQYGKVIKKLGASSYKLVHHTSNERGVYTFCMCPGGVVVGSSSEEGMVVTNGMSYHKRDKVNANSALLVNVKPSDYNGEEHPLNGIEFQRELERKAYVMGGSNYNAPAQTVGDYLANTKTTEFATVTPSYRPGVTPSNLNELFPDYINESLHEALPVFAKKLKEFNNMDAVMTGVESRSSSPVTILRDENLMSNIVGIYPCGEGSGYAGGIVTAALDGMKVAEKIIESL